MHWLKLLLVPCKENDHRPRILGRAGITALLAVMLLVEGFLVASVVVRDQGRTFLAAVEEAALIALTNGDRASNDVGGLTENAQLDAAAQAKANDMVAKGYFAHVGPDGKEPWAWITGAGYRYEYAGENLAVHFSDSSDVEAAWMASPTHRANILKPEYTEVGIGIAQGTYQGQPATYVVQYLASPATAAVAATPKTTPAVAEEPSQTPVSQDASAPIVAGASDVVQSNGTAAAEIAAPQSSSITRALVRVASSPQQTAMWVLGGLLILLLAAIGIAFGVRLRVQSAELLLGGVAVAGIAALFLTLNSSLLPSMTTLGGQAASVALVSSGSIDESATSTASHAFTASSEERPVLVW